HTVGPFNPTVDASGQWSVDGIDVSAFDDGQVTYRAAVDDGSTVTAATDVATKDVVAPDLQISSVTDPIVPANETAAFAVGTAEPGAYVELSVTDGTHTLVLPTTADGSGDWSFDGLDLSSYDDGTISFAATATDNAGNSTTRHRDALKDTVTTVAISRELGVNLENQEAVA